MALQKDSPYLWVFNEQILRMYESGDLNRIHIINDPPTHFCGNKSGSPLGFKSCITPFLILAGGIALATITLMGESLVAKWRLNQTIVADDPIFTPRNNEVSAVVETSNRDD